MGGTDEAASPMLGALPSLPPRMDAPLHTITDPYLASFLKSQKAELTSIKRIGPKTVEFRFAANARLHNLLRLYWSNEPIWLVPSRLMDALRSLKSRSITRE